MDVTGFVSSSCHSWQNTVLVRRPTFNTRASAWHAKARALRKYCTVTFTGKGMAARPASL
jgi:hypothetical protein